jgi:DNA-binding NtrC family response regulator
MVYGIVKQHGGFIDFESEPGMGTTFRIFIPALPRESQPFEIEKEHHPSGGNETVLLVENDDSIRDLGTRYLSRAGYKVLTAANGSEAFEICRTREKEIALVIIDLMMPDITGKQCLEELSRISSNVKVLVAGGYANEDYARSELLGLAKGFVHKPYEKTQLLSAIRQILDQDDL